MSDHKLEFLNIVPMIPGYAENFAEDTLKLYQAGAIDSAAFILPLVPEGNPPVDKGRILGERFIEFRRALGGTDMPVGILLQSTLGHGWVPSEPSFFQRITNAAGNEPYSFCPLDPAFHAYLSDTVKKLARLKPDFFMVDDDFRLLTGKDGCYCPLHLARFNREHGTKFGREELLERLQQDEKLQEMYDSLLKTSLVELARTIRNAIDSEAPGTPCSVCACGQDVRHICEIAPVLAAPGEKVTVRINNARYCSESLRYVPEWLQFTAGQIAGYPRSFRLFAEPDTCPHNRYSTSASMMHLQVTGSILEGCRGGKFWLSRTGSWEPESGKAYRKILTEFRGFYETLSALEISWTGVASLLPGKSPFNFPLSRHGGMSGITWSSQIFGKMGIPFYFSTAPGETLALAGKDCDLVSDKELERLLLEKNVLLDGPAAIAVCRKGLGALIGVEARPWKGKAVTLELLYDGSRIPAVAANDSSAVYAELVPGKDVEILSRFYHAESGCSDELSEMMPGCTCFTRPDGMKTCVIATPVLPYSLAAFSMLNQSRKKLLLEIFQRFGGLRWYVPGDDEVLLKTGRCGNTDILFLVNLSLDDMVHPELAGCHGEVKRMEQLLPDGSWQEVPYRIGHMDGMVELGMEIRPGRPLVLRAECV